MADPQKPDPATVAGNPNANVPGKPETQGGPDKNPPPGSMNNPVPQQVPKSATPEGPIYKISDFAGHASGPFSLSGVFGADKGVVLVDGTPVETTRWNDGSIKGYLPASYKHGQTVQVRTASGHTLDVKK